MKKIRHFIPVNVPKLYNYEKKNILSCLKTNWISSEGKYVNEFEKNFSKFNLDISKNYHSVANTNYCCNP